MIVPLAIRWLLAAIRGKSGRPTFQRLADELIAMRSALDTPWLGIDEAIDAALAAPPGLVVLADSAAGHHRSDALRVPFGPGDGVLLPGLHHLQLVNHPEVYRHLARWLA